MAISHICGFELGHINEFNLATGAGLTVQSTVKRNGTYALRLNPTASNAFLRFGSRIVSSAGYRSIFKSCRFYMRVDTIPGGTIDICHSTDNTGVNTAATPTLRMNGTGKLVVSPDNNVTSNTAANSFPVDGQFHRVDWDVGYNGGNGVRVLVDGVVVAFVSTGTPASSFQFGFFGSSGTWTADIYIDGVVWHDTALPTVLNDYSVGMLLPTSDSSVGGWKRQDGTTATSLFGSVNNVPPAGTASTVLGDDNRIENIVSSATDDFDAVCAAYSTVVTGGIVTAIMPIANTAQEITTGSPKNGALNVVANPSGLTEQGFDFGIPNGTAGSITAAAFGTFPTGWGTNHGLVTENPSVALASGPTVRVGKRVATTREVSVDFLGVYVVWEAAIPPRRRDSSVAVMDRASSW